MLEINYLINVCIFWLAKSRFLRTTIFVKMFVSDFWLEFSRDRIVGCKNIVIFQDSIKYSYIKNYFFGLDEKYNC